MCAHWYIQPDLHWLFLHLPVISDVHVEAAILGSIQHPNIVSCLGMCTMDVGGASDRTGKKHAEQKGDVRRTSMPFLVLEYVPYSLEDVLDDKVSLSLTVPVCFGVTACRTRVDAKELQRTH